MPSIDPTDPTAPVACNDETVTIDQDSQQFASLALDYYKAQINIQGAQAEVDDLTRQVRTPSGTTQRHFTVANVLAAKEFDAKLTNAKLKLNEAEATYKGAYSALDKWIPSSLKPFLQVTGCITAPCSGGEYPFIGITMPKDKYMVIQALSEEAVANEARRQKEFARHDSEY